MTALVTSARPALAVPNSTTPHRPARRTLLGFVATRRVVEVILTLVLADPRIAAHHLSQA